MRAEEGDQVHQHAERQRVGGRLLVHRREEEDEE